MNRPHGLAVAVAGLTLASLAYGGAAVAGDSMAPPTGGPRCDYSQVVGEAPPYPGRSASRLFDRLFAPGPALPHLNHRYIPQGLTTWENWDGAGNDLLLVGMYRKNRDSYLAGLDPVSGRHVGTVRVDEAHLGGVGVLGQWLIAQHTVRPGQTQAVRRYRLEALRGAMLAAAAGVRLPYLAADGAPQEVDGASFMGVAEGSLWMGRFSRSRRGHMYRYEVDSSGLLVQTAGPWRVPPRSQGVLVTPRHFVFASSAGRTQGRLQVYRRTAGPSLGTPVGCLWTPSLPQNLTLHRGIAYASFESGARRFDQPGYLNKVRTLLVADLSAVLRVADQVVSPTVVLPG
ncbi:MAG: hypothetical protein ACT4QF_24800 [Sporichthyaceae bacterium]